MGLKFSKPHPPTVCQIKTPVQSVENPEGFGGMIIYDQETFTINKPHLMAVPDHRALISFEQLCQTTSVLKASEDK